MNTKNLKPFNLEAALKGEPVMLRDGSKAFIRHHETEQKVDEDFRLWGVAMFESGRLCTVSSWATQGKWRHEREEHKHDIIGMWPKTRIINGFEVPAPENKELKLDTHYHMSSLADRSLHDSEVWDDHAADKCWLKRGLVFLNKEDAMANAKAMLGIDPYEEIV